MKSLNTALGDTQIGMRKPDYKVDSLFPNRWSPRAMSGEPISDEELMTLFEAARWAPSSYNNQPWRFLYTKRDTKYWSLFYDLLNEGNKVWAKNAAVLMVVVSKKTFDFNEKPSITHSFDTGAAWENLALQGTISGLVVHGMQGFNYKRAKDVLNVPEDYCVEAMVAVGRRGRKEDLPNRLREIEFPSDRKDLSKIVKKGIWK
jgi:nitroreductase